MGVGSFLAALYFHAIVAVRLASPAQLLQSTYASKPVAMQQEQQQQHQQPTAAHGMSTLQIAATKCGAASILTEHSCGTPAPDGISGEGQSAQQHNSSLVPPQVCANLTKSVLACYVPFTVAAASRGYLVYD